MSVNVLLTCKYVHYMCVRCPQRIGKGIESPGVAATDGCEAPRGC